MTAPDFAAIIDDAAHAADALDHAGYAVLAAKVSELCRTCGGLEFAPQCHPEHDAQGEDCGCPANFMPCPDCPTIAKLLAIGAAAMTSAVVGQPFDFTRSSYAAGIRDCLDELRAVQP